MSNAKHLTTTGRRRAVKRGTAVQVWLEDGNGQTVSASVVTDLCWGNLIVRTTERQARVEWRDGLDAYRLTRWL